MSTFSGSYSSRLCISKSLQFEAPQFKTSATRGSAFQGLCNTRLCISMASTIRGSAVHGLCNSRLCSSWPLQFEALHLKASAIRCSAVKASAIRGLHFKASAAQGFVFQGLRTSRPCIPRPLKFEAVHFKAYASRGSAFQRPLQFEALHSKASEIRGSALRPRNKRPGIPSPLKVEARHSWPLKVEAL